MDEMSTINQRRLVMARRIVTKLLAYGGMSDNPEISGRNITVPFHRGGRSLKQIIPERVRVQTLPIA